MYSYLKKHKFFLIYLPLVIYWIVLFTLTTIPGSQLPDVGISDKFSHLFAYMILSILLSLTFLMQEKRPEISSKPFLFTILAIFLYSIVDEVHQIFIPGRFFELLDIAADVTGTLAGTLITKLLVKVPEREREPAH